MVGGSGLVLEPVIEGSAVDVVEDRTVCLADIGIHWLGKPGAEEGVAGLRCSGVI